MTRPKKTALKSLLDTMKAMFRDMSSGHRKEVLGKNIAAIKIKLDKLDDRQERN
jgi:hypothetical protein